MEQLTIAPTKAKAVLGIGRTKLYELINDGTLQTVQIGRRRMIKTDSIRALVDQAA